MLKEWLQSIFTKSHPFAYEEWRTDHSILNFINSKLDKDGSIQGLDLPDEIITKNKIRYAPGLFDAMFGADNSNETKNRVAELSRHLKRIALNGNIESDREFYRLISESESVIGAIDAFLQEIVKEPLPIEPHLIRFAKDLISKSQKRNAVKFGIAILGLCQNKAPLDEIKILGQHDEFTVYATVAIMQLSENIEWDLWELAKKVDGWGKIQLVDRLSQLELTEPIKDWLIYEGYKNGIMIEYLAYTCAIKGELHTKLDHNEIDHKFFKSSSDIIEALVTIGGPAEDITTYPFASQVIWNFIKHAQKHATDVSDFNVIHKINDYLSELKNDIGDQKQNGWTLEVIAETLVEIQKILDSRDWRCLVINDLRSKDKVLYWNAKQAAEILAIDMWDTFWQRLNADPIDSSSWYDVTHYSKPERPDEIIDFALKHLPLDELSTGPSDSNGFGVNFNKFTSLEYATTFLESYPGKGETIVITGLRCPAIRNRNMAIRVLEKWGFDNWSTEIKNELKLLRAIEPNDSVKENLDRVLNAQG